MADASEAGRLLMVAGALLFLAGGALWLTGATGSAGRLPGDVLIRRGRLTVYVPLASCLLLSVLLTLILRWLRR